MFRRRKKEEKEKPVKVESKEKQVKLVRHETTRVILAPVVTEKAAHLTAKGTYVFRVASQATRVQVASAFKELYGVQPTKVNIIVARAETVRFGRSLGRTKAWKKLTFKFRPANKSRFTKRFNFLWPSSATIQLLPADASCRLTLTKTSRRKKPHRALIVARKHGGRNNQGKITVRHHGGGSRQFTRLIDWKQNKFGVPATVATIEYDPSRGARVALVVYKDGEKRYMLLPDGVKVGQTIMSSDKKKGRRLPSATVCRLNSYRLAPASVTWKWIRAKADKSCAEPEPWPR